MLDYKAAGYEFKISWLEWNNLFEMFLEKSFPTVSDALPGWLARLEAHRFTESGDEFIKNIKVEAL